MSTYSNRLQPALQNLLQRVFRFFHQISSCPTHISVDGRTKINRKASDVAEYIKLFGPFTRDRHGERTEQLDIFCRITGFTSDFLSFIDVEHIRFFHRALQL